MHNKILIIAGTEDGRMLVNRLAELKVDITVTVTTDYGASLIETGKNVHVLIGKWDENKIAEEIVKQKFELLIDASHPYAKNASANAMKACKMAGAPYLRYERKGLQASGEHLHFVNDFTEAVALCNQLEGNLFFAIGSNNLPIFAEGVEDFTERAFVRILPTAKMVEKAQQLGLTPKHIIAMQGPFTEMINTAMLKQVDAKVMITKESGNVGGFMQKVEAANKVGVVSIIIKRPDLEYSEVYNTIDNLVKAVESRLF